MVIEVEKGIRMGEGYSPIFKKHNELIEILQDMMLKEVGYTGVGSNCRMVFSPYGDAEDIGLFTIYNTLVFETGKPDMLRLTYIRVDSSDENDRLEISCELPDDFTPEITAGAIFDTWTQKSRSNIKVIEK